MGNSSGVLGPRQNWIHQPSDSYIFLGDHNASYNIFPYEVNPETEIVITGRYPYARNFSFNVIGEANRFITSVADHELLPDAGSTNPFFIGSNWDVRDRNYTLKIRFTAPPDGQSHFVPGVGDNVVYAGTFPNGSPNTRGLLILRIYVPSIGYDSTGGVGLPVITYCAAKQNTMHTTFSASDTQSQQFDILPEIGLSSDLSQTDFPRASRGGSNTSSTIQTQQTCDIVWRRESRLSQLIQPENNTTYIISNRQIQRDPGKFLFIRWKAPSVPDTYHNIGIVGNEDMRYWSMSFITPVGLIGLYTLGDFQMIVDKRGYVNLVLSFGAARPACVTPENGFTWADVSQLPLVPLLLFYRNNQISTSFPYTAQDVPAGETVPPEVMGEYYPCGKYVNSLYFDSPCNEDEDDWDANFYEDDDEE